MIYTPGGGSVNVRVILNNYLQNTFPFTLFDKWNISFTWFKMYSKQDINQFMANIQLKQPKYMYYLQILQVQC